MASVQVSDGFDGGNIEFVDHEQQTETESKVTLRIKPDP